MLKINPLDAHDRLLHIKKQSHTICECCQDLINQAPFGNRPFYIFAHGRTDDNGCDTRVIWQPRLTKPKAQTNSMLFKGYPGTDRADIIWIIPSREKWGQYKKGNITESSVVEQSIHNFQHDRQKLEAADPDDPTDEEIDAIYRELAIEASRNKTFDRLYSNY